MHRRPRQTALLLLTAALLGGCGYVEELKLPVLTETGEEPSKQAAAESHSNPEPRTYPEEAKLGKSLDIEVVRVGNAIRLENRTVHSYKDVELWLNHQYGAKVDKVPVGSSEPINLRSFVNHHGERYPVGRFLAPDADQALVLADLVRNKKIHKLTVRLGDDWRSIGGGAEPSQGGGSGPRRLR